MGVGSGQWVGHSGYDWDDNGKCPPFSHQDSASGLSGKSEWAWWELLGFQMQLLTHKLTDSLQQQTVDKLTALLFVIDSQLASTHNKQVYNNVENNKEDE